MSAAALPHGFRRHPSVQHRTPTAFALAVLMHLVLVGGISLMVRWKTQPAAPIVAELWSPTPPVDVAPPPPPPPPPPEVKVAPPPPPPAPPPDIVTKEVKKAPPPKEEPKVDPEIEKKKLEAEKKKLLEAEKKKAEAEKQKLELEKKRAEEKAAAEREALRKKDVDRLLAQAGTPGVQAPSAGARGEADYIARLVAQIRQHIAFNVPDGTSPQVMATFQIDQLPTGEVVRVRLVRSSGMPGYDAAVERAINRASPLPRKPDGTVSPTMTIDFRPVETK
jgi:colicin import membrane protein